MIIKPSANITIAMENQHKNHIFSNGQLPGDDQSSIISSKATPLQEKQPTKPSTCVARKALLMEDASDVQEKGLENDLLGREKLMRHWKEVSCGGRIVVPDIWGQEPFLKDWIDYSTFDALLAPKGVGAARESLVAEARRRREISRLSI